MGRFDQGQNTQLAGTRIWTFMNSKHKFDVEFIRHFFRAEEGFVYGKENDEFRLGFGGIERD